MLDFFEDKINIFITSDLLVVGYFYPQFCEVDWAETD